ncbi:hypothetical protein P7C73_g3598, partial [Tremellales sp. Uapishka_1]
MNTHTYEIIDAAFRHPHITVDVWGPSWAGYNRSIPLSENVRRRAHRIAQLERSKEQWELEKWQKNEEREAIIEKERRRWWSSSKVDVPPLGDSDWVAPEWDDTLDAACGPVQFEIVWTFSDIYKQNDPHVDALQCGSLLVQQLGDCHEMRCIDEWYPFANNITLSKYAFELQEIFSYDRLMEKFPNYKMQMFGHSPDTGNEWDFYPLPWSQKTTDASTFGFDGAFYPIRTTVNDRIREPDSSLGPAKIVRFEHPGYVIWPSDEARDHPLETYSVGHEYYAAHERTREEFAQAMREAKICVFDSSLEKKMIRKVGTSSGEKLTMQYAQAFLSGCVVASDLPTEHEEALSEFVIPLDTRWDIERINLEIQGYLDQPERLHQMAVNAFPKYFRPIIEHERLDSTAFFMRASLVQLDPTPTLINEFSAGYEAVKTPSGADATAGEVVQTPEELKWLDGRRAIMCVFAKLSVRVPGKFRLKFTLYETSE